MKTIISQLIHSRSSLSRFYATAAFRNGRCLSTDSNKVDEPLKVEEAETVDIPPPPTEKLLVLGGNGFVGSHICKEALSRGIAVASLSRSGRSSINDPWANNIEWHRGNLLSSDSWKEALSGVTSVISCVGGFGSSSYMYKINGTANINAIRAAAEKGVKRFVYISAADFGVANYLLQGYYEGKHPRSCSHCRRSLECRPTGSRPHALESPPPKCCKAPSPATQPPIPRGYSHCCRQCLKYRKILAIFLKNRGVRVREI
ncbi:uncharacterized protein LOC117912737 isoform X2 [Vitis riparia]|uniref:uncharacterized protein LOC117912737 isoform X2 n=1 Tax=Vitis riparia TaxID=96939 RepID=UPI00155A6772|nr:uncharacterized protein LOC117912737 isoform X2 [Vitis riparia]